MSTPHEPPSPATDPVRDGLQALTLAALDTTLSATAAGIVARLAHWPADWTPSVDALVTSPFDSYDVIADGIAELVKRGYLRIHPTPAGEVWITRGRTFGGAL